MNTNQYLEQVKKKRIADKLKKERAAAQKNALDESRGRVSTVVGAIDRQSELSRRSTQPVKIENDGLAKTVDVDQVVDSINQMNITTFMANKGLPEMSDNIKSLSAEVKGLITSFESEGLVGVAETFQTLASKLETIAKSLSSAKVQTDTSIIEAVNGLKKAIDNIEVNPVVNVDSPKVVVDTPEVDVAPIVNAIQELKQEPASESFSLSQFVAQDLDSESPGFQYVGLVRRDGVWCCIENDIGGSALRYAFGNKNYAQAWGKHTNLSYKRLDEALRGIST